MCLVGFQITLHSEMCAAFNLEFWMQLFVICHETILFFKLAGFSNASDR